MHHFIDLNTVVSKTDLNNCLKEIFSKAGGMLPEEESAEELVERIPLIDISVKMEQGIREFGLVLQEMFLEGDISSNEEIHITNLRQKEALAAAYDALQRVRQSIRDQMPEDFYSIDLMDAYEALGSITGETIGEDLVNEIFSKFCMGK